MNAEIMAEWFRRQGHHVIRSKSSYWYSQSLRTYQAFPYHWVITPGRAELLRLLVGTNAVALRYSTPLTAPHGSISYHCVYENGSYNLPDLPRRARGAIRKGLRNLEIKPISLDCLSKDGWELRVDTMKRQGRPGSECEDYWHTMCVAAADLPGFEAWGAFCQGNIASTLFAFTCDDCYTLLYQQSAEWYLSQGANNALTYVVTHEASNRPGIRKVFYGLESLNACTDVDVYKIRMGYTAKPLRQRVVIHPAFSPLFNRYSHGVIKSLRQRYPDKTALSKMDGMMHFYRNGKLPLDKQIYPAALADGIEEVERLELEESTSYA